MPPGAPDSISYLPTSLMNHCTLIKLTMPLSPPAADANAGLCVSALCAAQQQRNPAKCVRGY